MAIKSTGALADIPLFSGIGAATRKTLAARSAIRRIPARSVIFSEAAPAKHLHVLLRGSVEVFSSIRGSEATIDIISPTRSFILAAVICDALLLMSARTHQVSDILFLPSDVFRSAFRHDAVLAVNVAEELGRDFRTVVKHMRDQKLRTGKERLATYLLMLARENVGMNVFALPTTKRVLASLLGVQPASLSRAFAELSALGVSVSGNSIHVHDIAALAEFANTDWVIDNPWC